MSASEAPIVVVARWTVAAAAIAEVRALLPQLQRQSLAEPGCLGYEVLESGAAPEVIVLIERYRDAAAIDAHRNTAHYRELVASRIAPLLVQRQVDLLTSVG
ncbi:MAG: antibiotic biosynthesis monooxygenase [Pseudoxanthomonas spadix]|jgi:quinol monooxygenase YgiN|nr:MAG: antibiotic biosynthesis monooxygenase [Pseudoxanthomonas spadix]